MKFRRWVDRRFAASLRDDVLSGSAVGGEGGTAGWGRLREAIDLGAALRAVGLHGAGVRCQAVSGAAWDNLRHAVNLGAALRAGGVRRAPCGCWAPRRWRGRVGDAAWLSWAVAAAAPPHPARTSPAPMAAHRSLSSASAFGREEGCSVP
jgi:hypothetical protein